MNEREDQAFEALLERRSELSRRYRDEAREEPSTELDASILAAARREAGARPRAVKKSWMKTWQVPASIAAVLVLSVGVTLRLAEREVQLSAPPAAPAASKVLPEAPGSNADLASNSAPPMQEQADKAGVPEPADELGDKRAAQSQPSTVRSAPRVSELASAAGSIDLKRDAKAKQTLSKKKASARAKVSPESAAQYPSTQGGETAYQRKAEAPKPVEGSRTPGEIQKAIVPTEEAPLKEAPPAPAPVQREADIALGHAVPEQPAGKSAQAFPESESAAAPPVNLPQASAELEEKRPPSFTSNLYSRRSKAEVLMGGGVVSAPAEPGGADALRRDAQAAAPAAAAAASTAQRAQPRMAEGAMDSADKERGAEEQSSPERWLKRIIDLRKEGRDPEADAELKKFKERYPGYSLPLAALKQIRE